jgi:hypothetical protein
MPAPARPAASPVQPFQQIQLKLDDLTTPGLPVLNSLFQQMFTQVNQLTGTAGPTQLASGVDVAGKTVSNLGEPQTATDAVSKGHAERNYSAAALAPQLESGGPAALKTYRALNSKQQQENYSNFLEGVLNTAPTANTSTITAGAPSGGSVVVTVSAGQHLYVSGNQVSYAQRSDTLALPTSFAISSITRMANTVTASAVTSLTVGTSVVVAGVTDTSYDGNFIITGATGSTLTWTQIGADSSSSGGSVAISTAYYYFLSTNSLTLALSQSYASDTQQNRISANQDGSALIAVAVLNSGGLDTAQSSAGATPPAVTGGIRLQLRL